LGYFKREVVAAERFDASLLEAHGVDLTKLNFARGRREEEEEEEEEEHSR
jgi:hypothetical protein